MQKQPKKGFFYFPTPGNGHYEREALKSERENRGRPRIYNLTENGEEAKERFWSEIYSATFVCFARF